MGKRQSRVQNLCYDNIINRWRTVRHDIHTNIRVLVGIGMIRSPPNHLRLYDKLITITL